LGAGRFGATIGKLFNKYEMSREVRVCLGPSQSQSLAKPVLFGYESNSINI